MARLPGKQAATGIGDRDRRRAHALWLFWLTYYDAAVWRGTCPASPPTDATPGHYHPDTYAPATLHLPAAPTHVPERHRQGVAGSRGTVASSPYENEER